MVQLLASDPAPGADPAVWRVGPAPTSGPTSGPASGASFDGVVDALRAVAEPTRLRLVALLGQGERTVSELTRVLGQSQPRVSRHLRILDEAGLLERTAEGSWVFCRLRRSPVAEAALALLPAGDPVLAADRSRLAVLDQERRAAAERYFQSHAEAWDSIRALHVSDAAVESLLLEAVGPAPVGDLLDVGTGTGRVLSLLAGRARSAIGIDRSSAMLAAARPAFAGPAARHVQLRLGDMEHLPLPPGSVDLAVFHQVLHYADEPAQALREVARVLRPAGRVLIVDFAPHSLESLREQHAHRRLGIATSDLVAWAAPAGFTVTELARLSGDPLTVVLWELRPAPSVPAPSVPAPAGARS